MGFFKRVKSNLTDRTQDKANHLKDRSTGSFNFNQLVEHGNNLFEKGDFHSALKDFSTAVEIAATEIEKVTALFNRGRVYSRLEKYQPALDDLNQAAELAPIFGLTYMERGLIYANLNDLSRAKHEFDRAIALIPRSQDWALNYLNRAEIYLIAEKHVLALLDVSIAFASEPNLEPVKKLHEKLQLEAKRTGKSLSDFSPQINQLAESFYRKASELHEKGDFLEALVFYTNAIDYGFRSAEIFYDRGVVNAKLNRLEAARIDLDQALELKPDFAAAFAERGMVWVEMEEEDKAMTDYDQAISLEPDYAIAHINKGSLYARQGKWEQALSCLDQGIALDKKAEALFNRAFVFEHLGKTTEAREDLKTFLTLYPENPLKSQVQERIEKLSSGTTST